MCNLRICIGVELNLMQFIVSHIQMRSNAGCAMVDVSPKVSHLLRSHPVPHSTRSWGIPSLLEEVQCQNVKSTKQVSLFKNIWRNIVVKPHPKRSRKRFQTIKRKIEEIVSVGEFPKGKGKPQLSTTTTILHACGAVAATRNFLCACVSFASLERC